MTSNLDIRNNNAPKMLNSGHLHPKFLFSTWECYPFLVLGKHFIYPFPIFFNEIQSYCC
jgi:hypothetical protein